MKRIFFIFAQACLLVLVSANISHAQIIFTTANLTG